MESNLTKGESFLDRARCKRPVGKPIELVIMLLASILVILLALFVNLYAPVPKIAHAAYEDVHSTAAACAYFELYPEKISNVKEYKKNCHEPRH